MNTNVTLLSFWVASDTVLWFYSICTLPGKPNYKSQDITLVTIMNKFKLHQLKKNTVVDLSYKSKHGFNLMDHVKKHHVMTQYCKIRE